MQKKYLKCKRIGCLWLVILTEKKTKDSYCIKGKCYVNKVDYCPRWKKSLLDL